MESKYWDLIAKKLSGEINAGEEQELNSWLQSDSNTQTFKQASKLWENTEDPSKDYIPNTEIEWQKLHARVNQPQEAKVLPLKRYMLKIAATVLLALGLTYLLATLFKTSGGATLVEVVTTDSITVVYLPDSSRVYLNKNTILSYPEKFNSNERLISLSGEGFFDVKPGNVPFIISCHGSRTKVLGTSFNVKGYKEDEEVEVIVVTGHVELSDEDDSSGKIVLEPNDRGAFNKKHSGISKSKNTRKDFKSWTKHNLERDIKKIIRKVKRKIK
jgi:transmembrane sensor